MGKLVVTRKPGERIVLQIPGQGLVWLMLDDIRRGTCKLVVDAPEHIRVDREEVYLSRVMDGVDQ